MEEPPRCLLILPVMPHSCGSGLQQRAFHLLQLLSHEHAVIVFRASQEKDRPCSASVAVAAGIEVVPVTTHVSLGRIAALWFPLLVLYRPTWAAGWPEIEAGYVLPKIIGPIKLCVTFRLRMHGVTEVIRHAFKPERMVLDLDDVESATLMSIGRFTWRRMRLRLGLNCLTKAIQSFCLERVVAQRYDRILLANPADVRALSLYRGRAKVMCLPNRISVTELAPPPAHSATGSEIRRLLFVGTLGYFPNEDAALWISESIVPALRRRLAMPFVVRVVGRHASPRLREKLGKVSEIEFVGEVSKLGRWYAETDIALVVVRCGGGTKIKALEAVANSTPIVATSHGMYGLELEPGKDYLQGETADAIADRCAELLQHPEKAAAMARRAHERLKTGPASGSTAGAGTSLPF